MAATSIPIGQVVASLLLLAATAFLLTWLAGKIYRVGILSTGKRPTLREVGHWLRAA
nr:ABC transporter permease [Gemmatimonadota bacterium]